MLIDEHRLDAFRREQLSPAALLALVEQYVWTLIKLGIGVGKSFAVDALLASPALYARFDLVVYVAPLWSVIRERAIVAGRDVAPVLTLVVEPRPRKLCGEYASRWSILERQGCSALAKSTLCTPCGACAWPDQLKQIQGTGLVFVTEQQFRLNRALLAMLRSRTGASRVLFVMDEAKLLDASFEMTIEHDELRVFGDTLKLLQAGHSELAPAAQEWLSWVESLLKCSATDLAADQTTPPLHLLYRAADVQQVGVRAFGKSFRFLGYDLLQLRWSRYEERSKDRQGTIRFTARPYLNTHMLVLSAQLDGDYVAHRLGEERVSSPFSDVLVKHSGTSIINVQSRLGADRYFQGNKKQILDTFAVVLLRNIRAGRTTLLISRKKSKAACAEYLAGRLRGWGVEVKFIVDGSVPPKPAVSTVVPVIHYGVLGVNDYAEYECAYCLNSYYLSSAHLSKQIQEFDPERTKVELEVTTGVGRRRRVQPSQRGVPDQGRGYLGGLYLRRLELGPVMQAAGRVRYLTRPREVVFMQMADMAPEVGTCTSVATLHALREELGIPSAKEIDVLCTADAFAALRAQGLSAEAAAKKLGISRATAFRRQSESLKSSLRALVVWRGFETGGGRP